MVCSADGGWARYTSPAKRADGSLDDDFQDWTLASADFSNGSARARNSG